MPNKTIITAIALIGITAAGLYAAPKIQQRHITTALHNAGLSNLQYSTSHFALNGAHFTNITLDAEGISKAKALTITLSPISLITGAINSIIIDTPDIIGSLNDDNTITIDGLDNTTINALKAIAPKAMHIRNAELTLLTPDYGAITLTFNASATQKQDTQNHYDVTANFDSRQKHLSLVGKASGVASPDFLSADIDIETGKLNIPDKQVRLTRITGNGNITWQNNQTTLISQLRAGGLQISGLPWHNISATLSYKNNELEGFLSAASIGVKGLELSASTPPNTMTIHATSADHLKQYLTLHKTTQSQIKTQIQQTLQTEISFQ